jgi:LysM repeat protein
MHHRNWVVLAVIIMAVFGLKAEPAGAQCLPRADWTGTHIVARGENLFRIARKYGLTAPDLAVGNCIPNVNRIFVGQRLRVPGGSTQPANQSKLLGNPVALRLNPAVTAPAVATLTSEWVLIYGRTQDAAWVYVQTKDSGLAGWMARQDVPMHDNFLYGLPVIQVGGGDTFISARVPGTSVRLRAGPGFNYRVVTYIHNQTVRVMGRSVDSNWLKVNAFGVEGWVYSYLVELDGGTIARLPVVS